MMIRRSNIFKRVTIVGIGLMGGSLGKAIKKHKLAKEVIGLSHRQSSLVQAIKNKAIDTAHTDIPKAIKNADFVILATPVESIVKLLGAINPYLKRGCLVTDVGSTKSEIIDKAESVLSVPSNFVGSHPMTGSEKKGVDNANEDLYRNSLCIMTPTKTTNQSTIDKVKLFWTKLGAKVKFISPEEHDKILSYISHLPHLMAYGLMETIPDKILDYSSTGLRDTTRIASSSPKLWSDICLANSKNIVHALDEYVKYLSAFRKAIAEKDNAKLLEHFTRAKEKRDRLGPKTEQ